MKIKVKPWNHDQPVGIKEPSYPGDAGMDLVATEEVTLKSGEFADVPHNFAIEVPLGFFGYVMPRSSTIKHTNGQLIVMASPIDSGYRGQIYTLVRNNSDQPVTVKKGERISQLVILSHMTVDQLETVDELADSDRWTNGFGSTGA